MVDIPNRLLVIESSIEDFVNKLESVVLIVPFDPSSNDMHLVRLSNYLNRLHHEPHLVRYNARHFKLSKIQKNGYTLKDSIYSMLQL